MQQAGRLLKKKMVLIQPGMSKNSALAFSGQIEL